MAGTTLVALKAALKQALSTSPAFSGVQISYGQRPDGRREQIWLGAATIGDQNPAGMRAGPKRRYEEYEAEVFVNVVGKATPEKNEARTVELVTAIEEIIADPSALADNVPGLMWVTVQEMEWDTAETGDGPSTVVRIQLNARGNIL